MAYKFNPFTGKLDIVISDTDTDEKVAIDSDATAGYLGANSTDGVLRTDSPLTYSDGGDFVTLGIDQSAIDHGSLAGLSDDDHTQYLLIDGTRAMTGDLTFDYAGAKIIWGENGDSYIRVLGANDRLMDFELFTPTNTEDAFYRFFRNSTTTGTREFRIFKGDGSATQTFVVDADTGDTSIYGSLDFPNANSNITNLGDVTFQTGATGGTIRTGVSNADKWELQAYDVDGGAYIKVAEADAGNEPTFEVYDNSFQIRNFTDEAKRVDWDISGITTGNTRTLTVQDSDGTIAYTSDIRTDEEIEDIIGAMVSGNTETLISVTYDDSDGTLDFVVDNNLANYSNANSNFFDTAGTGLSSTGSTVNLNASFNDLTNVIYTNQNGSVIVDNGTNLVRLDAPILDGDYQLEVEKSGSTFTFSWGNAVPIAPAWSAVLTQGRTSSGTNPQLTTGDNLEFRDSAIYITSDADGDMILVADDQIRLDAAGQVLIDDGMSVNLPAVSSYVVGFRVDASSVGYPGIRFLRTATAAGDVVMGTDSVDSHIFGSLGSARLGDVTHTDGTNSMTYDASLNLLSLSDSRGAMKMPTMTTVQRNALTPAAGWIIFNTTDSKFQGYDGSNWQNFH